VPREKLKEIPRDIPREILRDFPREIPKYLPRPIKEPAPIIPTRRRKIIKQPVGKSPSYDVFVKDIKGKKFSKINKSPIAFNDAKDLQAYAIDKSVARTSFLKPSQAKPRPLQYAIPKGYYQNTKSKYRDWRQKEGKRYKMKKDKIIEYSKYALDSKNEKKQLSIFKLLAQREKKKRKLNRPSWESFA